MGSCLAIVQYVGEMYSTVSVCGSLKQPLQENSMQGFATWAHFHLLMSQFEAHYSKLDAVVVSL
jgi:hypothetical protein